MPAKKYVWDENGILIPALDRFPSSANGAGFKPLADWVHAQGLKFGIHIVRGIPRQVVKDNLPIAGTSFHAQDAADIPATCPWDEGNYGVADNAAGQAYYDSMLKLYAGWGLDFIKVDCISDHPYRPTEIRQIAEAIRKTGRPIVLSLSPGPTQLDHAAEVAKYAQMWRITDDHWDVLDASSMTGPVSSIPLACATNSTASPMGALRQARQLARSTTCSLKVGLDLTPARIRSAPSRYTQDEQRTEFTLWAISRSPLILGTNLTRLDDFTRSLITNKEVLDINQHAVESRPGLVPYAGNRKAARFSQRYWYARTGGAHPARYIAVFNLADDATKSDLPWMVFHLTGEPHAVYDIWNQKRIPQRKSAPRRASAARLRALPRGVTLRLAKTIRALLHFQRPDENHPSSGL